VNIDSRDFNWSTSFNISANRNKLIAFPGLESSTYATTYKIGQPLSISHLYQNTGVNPQTGIYEFRDFDGDGNITALEDRKVIADLTPEFFGGLQNQIAYKGFSLDFLFQFVKQQNLALLPGAPGTAVNQISGLADVWQQNGDIASSQQFTTGANDDALNAFYRYSGSTGVVKDASFIRLKNISVSYDIPPGFLDGMRVRLFAQGQNLLTITSFKYGDPELRYGSFLPPLRVFSAGVQISF
jgi:TonB-dependent starch-binding outer membrane protein SusC